MVAILPFWMIKKNYAFLLEGKQIKPTLCNFVEVYSVKEYLN